MILNLINVKNPQGQEHVCIFCEFSGGVKDTYHNVRVAAFQDGSLIKSDMEAVGQRRVVILKLRLRISQDETRTQVILASNTDAKHDIYSPQPLPILGGVTGVQAESISDENRMGIVALDFSLVDSVRVLHKDRKTVLGLSFFDSSNGCIATSFFREPMKIEHLSIDTVSLELQQIQMGGVFSIDLAFLSTFQGHQGASSKSPCNFCLAKLAHMKMIFHPDCPNHELRTAESTLEDGATFKRLFEDLPVRDQTKALRTSVSQNLSHSIIQKLMAKFPFECILKALLHVRLGISRSVLDWIFDFYMKIEELYSGECYTLRRSIQDELDRLIAFEAWMDEELSDFTTSISGHEKQMEDMMARLEDIQQVLDIPRISPLTRSRYEDSLAKVKGDLDTLEKNSHSDDELEFVAQLTEMKRIASENIKHLRILISKHDGYSRRLIVGILKLHTVDIQVYFNGVLNGAHCISLAKNGDKIISDITAKMLDLVADDDTLCNAVRKFDVQMKRILKPWYSLMRFMTSTDRHSASSIAEFKANLTEMKSAMLDAAEQSPALEGEDNPLKLPTTLKAHILFGKHTDDATISHALQQVIDFEATGSLDEQNGERTHAEVNQLMRQFGNTRGKQQKMLCLREFHWRNISLIRDKIEEMKNATKRVGGTSRASAPQIHIDDHRETSNIDELPDDFETSLSEELTSDLTDEEIEINNNNSLRGPINSSHKDFDALSDESKKLLTGMDTKIVACPCCLMRFIGRRAFNIHATESHSLFICSELDSNEETTRVTVR